MPPATYYAALGASLKERYPEASEAVREHLEALEAFLDVCIVSGYSLGAAKSLDRLMQPSLEALGEVCGRDGAQACEHHVKIIKEWGDIPNVSALRRFLGTFDWARGHFAKEVQAVLPNLNAALNKDAVFPLSGEQLRAKQTPFRSWRVSASS